MQRNLTCVWLLLFFMLMHFLVNAQCPGDPATPSLGPTPSVLNVGDSYTFSADVYPTGGDCPSCPLEFMWMLREPTMGGASPVGYGQTLSYTFNSPPVIGDDEAIVYFCVRYVGCSGWNFAGETQHAHIKLNFPCSGPNPGNGLFSYTLPSCTNGGLPLNNGSIKIDSIVNGDRYVIGFGDYGSSTALPALHQPIFNNVSNAGATYNIRIFNGGDDCYTDYTVTTPPVACTCITPSDLHFTYQPSTCFGGATAQNNGKLYLDTVSFGTHYSISTPNAASFDGYNYVTGATPITSFPILIADNIANTTNSYIIRIFDEVDGCYKDTNLTLTPQVCSNSWFAKFDATCKLGLPKNDGSLYLTSFVMSSYYNVFYGISTLNAATYNGPTSSGSATQAYSNFPIKLVSDIPNSGGNYIIRRIYQDPNDFTEFYVDTTINIAPVNCSCSSNSSSISGFIFNDANNNGILDNTESPYPFVTVKAYAPGSSLPTSTSISDGHGFYSLPSLNSSIVYRIEFENPTNYVDGAFGSGSATSVQFSMPGQCVNHGLRSPGNCLAETNPRFVTGSANFPNSSIMPYHNVKSFRFNDKVAVASTIMEPDGTIHAHQDDIDVAVGVPYAMATQKSTKKIFFTTCNTQANMDPIFTPAPDGNAAIYVADYAGPNYSYISHKLLVKLNDIGIDVSNQYPIGNDTSDRVFGTSGLNGIDITQDGKTLFIVNAGNGKIVKLDISGVTYATLPASAPTSAQVNEIDIPTSVTNAINGRFRPTALNIKGNTLYIGGVNDGANGNDNDLDAKIISMDISTNVFSEVFSFKPSSFTAGSIAYHGASNKKWSDIYSLGAIPPYTLVQPYINDFDFDDEGALTILVGNRTLFNYNTNLNFDAGYMIRAVKVNATQYQLENAGTSGIHSSINVNKGPVNTDGPGGKWFYEQGVSPHQLYNGQNYNQHYYLASGGVYNLSGSGYIVSGVADPFTLNQFGARFYDPSSGHFDYGISLGGTKAAAMTGTEAVCDGNPVEIGNLVWKDINGNGIQDGDEPGIPGVSVAICSAGNNTPIATAITDANGNYIFSNATGVSTTSLKYGLLINSDAFYDIKVSSLGSDPLVAGLTLSGSLTGVIGENSADPKNSGRTLSNSDAFLVSGIPTIKIQLGSPGDNNHTYDFGFKPIPVCAPPNAGVDLTACAGTCMDLTGTNPTTGTWSAMSGNPSGATLGTTTNGVANVCFNNTANGTFSFIYNIGASCEDTMSIVVHTPGSVGNYVWLDENHNGLNDEPSVRGINGVTVELWKETSTGSGIYVLDQTTSTTYDGSSNPGYYNFVICTSANYKVKFPLVTNLSDPLTTPTTTAGTDNNSDANTTTGESPVFAIDVNGTGLAKNNNTIDVGYFYHKACLGNYVWNDMNKDGIQNNGEVGVAGITVSLLDNGLNTIGSTITDAYGFYQFCSLIPGTYSVTFTLPSNYTFTSQNSTTDEADSDVDPTTGITTTYVLAAGDSNMTADAGIYFEQPTTASVGNYVWLDVNQNGIQDGNEQGISGVTVTLYNSAGDAVATMPTNANGFYLFTNVTPGNYSVGFTAPVGLSFTVQNGATNNASNSDADPSTGVTAPFTVNAGDEITYVDAGLFSLPQNVGSLGNRVWYDEDQDGVQDATETGVNNVTVTLYQQDGTTMINQTVTDAYGNYIFNNLPQGSYVVGFSNLPLNYVFTITSGTDSTTNSDANIISGKTAIIYLAQGQHNMTYDAGIYTTQSANTNSIGNYVWDDLNKDGIQSNNEPGVAGVTVTLYDNTNAAIATTFTDANGLYLFPNLPNGTYYVGFSNLPLNYVFSPMGQGTNATDNDADASTGKTATTTLTGNTHDMSLDAGINYGSTRLGLGTLGDLVWYDMNNNGLQDNNELGVQGVTVTLYESNGTTVISTTTTNALGNYIFTGLEAGAYVVGFDNLPSGFSLSPKNADNEGLNGEANSDVNSGTNKTDLINLGEGEDKMSVDMGITPPAGTAGLGNYVWMDLNNDGIQTSGEPGVQGIGVTLYDNTNTAIATTTTDANGAYSFVGLTPGTYSVGFDNLPNGFGFATENSDAQGINGANNSDANAITGMTNTVTLASGDYNPNLDAGIVSTTVASVGDYVWYDMNQDGLQDANEPGIGGILVTLYNSSNTAVASTITRPDGSYIFTNVIPGDYTMGFSNIPSGMEFTQEVGTATDNNNSNVNPTTGLTATFTVIAGTHNPTIDAGLTTPINAGLGNYVWYDVDKDGVQDSNEPGIAGAIVTLYAQNGTTVLGTAITDGNGAYTFTNLPAGQYSVCVSNVPYIFHSTGNRMVAVPTVQNAAAGTDETDSDINPAGGCTINYTLAAGEYNPTLDAGFVYQFAVPVVMKDFMVLNDQCNVFVNWVTSSEKNTNHYNVMRTSTTTNTTTQVAQIMAKGTTQSETRYSYTDRDVATGTYTYHLEIVDIDGQQSLSDKKSVQVNCQTNTDKVSVYPNPTTGQLNIRIVSEQNDEYTINVRDAVGRLVMQSTMEVNNTTKNMMMNLGGLAAGTYSVEVLGYYQTQTFKIQLSK